MQRRFRICLVCAGITGFAGSGSAQELPTPCISCAGGPATFVTSGQANYVVSGSTGTVTQQSDRAILNWQSFNVSAGATINFQQPSTSSAALNRIFQSDASKILGALNANGQVYLINQNGILFGQGSQINTGALTASTLDVADDIFNDIGVAGAINLQRAAFEGVTDPDASIRILEGASITADQRVLVIAPSIENRGTIETAGGQTILAASHDKVYLASDRDLRGFLVEVDTGGSVENLGEIIAERGNVTLTGLAVNQSGRISATTSTNLNGSIRLLARDRASAAASSAGGYRPVAARTGELTFGEGSITEVLPETQSSETAVDGQKQLLSSIEGMGRTVEVRTGAQLVAPGGRVNLQATTQPANPGSGADPGSRIHLAAGSVIDVSGDASAVVAMERNQGRIKLFGNELADAPVQRGGPLSRQEIAVDLREGTQITDISRLRDDVRRGVGERLSTGGAVVLGSEGDVVLQAGSLIDFSGGQVRYLDGYVETTKVVTPDGRVVDVKGADPGSPYAGFFGGVEVRHEKWGVTERFRNLAVGDFQPGYVEGKDAGSLTIDSVGGVALDGALRGASVVGEWQRDPASDAASGVNRPHTEVPLGGLLAINAGRVGAPNRDLTFDVAHSPGSVAFDTAPEADSPIRLSTQQLIDGGVNRLQASVTGSMLLPEHVDLALGSGGEVALTANAVQIDGDIRIPSGQVQIASRVDGAEQGSINVGDTAEIDVRGMWVNDHASANIETTASAPLFVDGGAVVLTSRGDLSLAEGSIVDVSAGARLQADGSLAAGSAGSISLTSAIPDQNAPTTLDLSGDLLGYGFDAGGSLSLSAASFRISDSGAVEEPIPGQVVLGSEFFQTGGFGSYRLVADRGDFLVEDGVGIRVSPLSLRLNGNHQAQRTGADVRDLTDAIALFEFERAPTSFSAAVRRTTGVVDEQATVRIGENASILTEAAGSITLAADTDLYVNGLLSAPGGDIQLTLNAPGFGNEQGFRADQGIWIGGQARLDASGVAQTILDPLGLVSGEILAGGHISLNAQRGYIVTRPGSMIDVSGTQQAFDLPAGEFGLRAPTTLASDAGDVSIRTAEGAVMFGDMRGAPGGVAAEGGAFEVVVNEGTRDPNSVRTNPAFAGMPQFLYSPREIRLVQTLNGDVAEGDVIPSFLNGQAFVSADELQDGGFDSIDLTVQSFTTPAGPNVTSPGVVRFDRDVSLTAGRRVALNAGVLVSDGGTASIAAPYVSLGLSTAILPTTSAAPAEGDGSLVVAAEHIDLRGASVFSGFAQDADRAAITLASRGDIRLIGDRLGGASPSGPEDNNVGSITSLAAIELSAAQIYPATLTEFSINVLGEEGRIAIGGGDAQASMPLSAAGVLRLSANEIVQGGVLRAPFGTIELDAQQRLELAPQSLTSTSGVGAVVPFGAIELGQDWVYPFGATTRVFDAAPAKDVILNGPEVSLAAGAVVDVSGGGDLLTYEFVKGPGGSRDILLGDNPDGSFAIVPSLGAGFGVFDPFVSPSAAIEVGSTIIIGEGAEVPSGEYAVLPARYALLPGAYLMSPVAGTDDIEPSSAQVMPDGVTTIVAGRRGFAGTDIQEARWSGYAVLNGDQVRQRSEFTEHLASEFFGENRGIPGDAGRLTIDADRSIRIDGALAAGAVSGGRAAQVDFVADSIAVVSARTDASDRAELVDTELQNFAAASLLLGGSRRDGDKAIELQVSAHDVSVEEGVDLTASEIVLAAMDSITVERGARLSGEGATQNSETQTVYSLSGDGAFVRASTDAQARVERTGGAGASGRVLIEEGASLAAAGSLNLEASRDVVSAGDLLTEGGSLSLTASLISLGEAPADATGLVLSSADLARFEAGELLLNSRSTIDFYGAVTADLNRVGLDTAGLRAFGAGDSTVHIAADDLTLRNTSDVAPNAPGAGGGTLALSADTLTLDAGQVDISGFATTSLTARREFVGEARSGLHAGGDLLIDAPRLTGGSGADVALVADGSLTTIGRSAPADLEAVENFGARMTLTAASIIHGSRIDTPSGIVELRATGAGGTMLSAGSSIDVSGRDVDFIAASAGSPGGAVSLLADMGDLSIADGASIDVSGGTSGGDAGRLSIRAAGGVDIERSAVLQGAKRAEETQGSVELVAGTLTNGFADFNTRLNTGGFNERRTLSLLTGDVTIAAGDTVNARVFELAADGGRIDAAGGINAAAAQGGRVRRALRRRRVARIGAHRCAQRLALISTAATSSSPRSAAPS